MHSRPLLLLFALLGLLSACSNRGWYEGIQQSTQRECTKDNEDCAPAPSYDEYRTEREERRSQPE